MRLLKLVFFKHLQGLFDNNKLRVLKDIELFKWSTVQQICLKTSALPPAFATSGTEAAHSLQIERPAMSSAEILELVVQRQAVREERSSAAEFCWENSPSLGDEKENPPPLKVEQVGSKKKSLSQSMVAIEKKREKPQCAVKRERNKNHEQLELKWWMMGG